MVIINDLLLYYYNFTDSLIKYDEKYIYYNGSTYILQKINKNSINKINREKYPLFHKIIKNKYNSIYSLYNNEYYVLLKINNKENNRKIIFEDIMNISSNIINYDLLKKNYFEIWNNKILFMEKYFYDYYNKEKIDFNYYNGLAYNALNLIKNINYSNITYGISYNRFYNINTLYDLYNPFNIEYGPIVDSIVEFIKYSIFYENHYINYDLLFDINLSKEDYYYLIARLLFPTYYYDLFKDNKIINDYKLISNKIYKYISYIKEIIIDIKKRHNDMSLINIINLL